MASTTRTLTVNVVGRTKNVEKAFKRVSKGSALMSDKMMRATRMAGIGFTALAGVAIGAAAALKPMIDKAASMEESLSKNNVVFGESSKAVEAFAATSLHAFGVTERAALEATGVIGTLGSALGMTEADSASMATTLVGLAGDMSSFNDASVEETLTAIQAGLRGESEPLRRFGVLLDAATLKAKALEKGIISSTKEALTPQTKALAAYELILEQTSIQMGDFTRTADSATNQSKLLAGEWDKIQTEIGTALLPAFTSIVTHLNEVVLPAVRQFWSDPSWYEGGVLAGQVLGSGFVTSITDVIGGLSEDEIDALGWQESWKASAELSALAAGVSAAWQFITGTKDELESDRAQEALAAAFEAAGAGGAFDRPPDQRGGGGGGGGGGTPATDIFNSIAELENSAAAIAAAAAAAIVEVEAEPMPGLTQAEKDAMTASAVAAAIQAALDATAAPAAVGAVGAADILTTIADLENAAAAIDTAVAAVTVGPTMEQITGTIDTAVAATIDTAVAAAVEAVAAAVTVGPTMEQLAATIDTAVAAAVEATVAAVTAAPSPTDADLSPLGGGDGAVSTAESDLEKFLKVVGTSDWAAFVGGGPPNTQITINASAVTAPEVIDLMGKYVQANGPLSRQWIGQ